MEQLLKSQKRAIFEALKNGGLDEAIIAKIAFSLVDGSNVDVGHLVGGPAKYWQLRLEDDGMEFFFRFQGKGNDWNYRAFPLGVGNSVSSNTSRVWLYLVEVLRAWAERVKEEVETEDPWAELENLKASFDLGGEGAEATENTPFTAAEARIAREKLALLERQISESFATNDEQIQAVERKFQYLSDAIERQGKQDWLYTFLGALASLAISLGVSAANNDQFWAVVKDAIGSPLRLFLGN